jgi:hypothetical protein
MRFSWEPNFLVWWQFIFDDAAGKRNFTWLPTPPLLIPCGGFMSLLSHLSRAMRWKIPAEPLGYKPALNNVFVTMVG